MLWIKQGSHGLNVDHDRTGVIGFSAGGHLAATLANGAALGDPVAALHLERIDAQSRIIDALPDRIEAAMGPFRAAREFLATIPAHRRRRPMKAVVAVKGSILTAA